MECRTFDRGEEFILRCVQQVPTKRHAAQLGIYQNSAIAIIPGETKKTCLSGAIRFQTLTEFRDIGVCAPRDGFENISGRRKAGFDAGIRRMHTARHHSADTRDKTIGMLHRDNAGRGADHVHHVAFLAAHADRIPMRVQGADRDGDAGLQAKLLCPIF